MSVDGINRMVILFKQNKEKDSSLAIKEEVVGGDKKALLRRLKKGWNPNQLLQESISSVIDNNLFGSEKKERQKRISIYPLSLAVRFGKEDMISFLIENGANINNVHPYTKETALLEATNHLNINSLNKLLNYSTLDVTCLDEENNTPLMRFLMRYKGQMGDLYRQSLVIGVLIERGVSVNKANQEGLAPIHLLPYNSKSLSDMVLAYHPILSLKDRAGRNLIHHCILAKNYAFLEEIISKGVSLNEPDNEGLYPIHYAILQDDKRMFSLLLEKGAKKDIQVDHQDLESFICKYNPFVQVLRGKKQISHYHSFSLGKMTQKEYS